VGPPPRGFLKKDKEKQQQYSDLDDDTGGMMSLGALEVAKQLSGAAQVNVAACLLPGLMGALCTELPIPGN
jgi:hypothetical protein